MPALLLALGAAVAGGGPLWIALAAAVGSGGGVVAGRWRAGLRRGARQRAVVASVPDVIDLLAATVDGGAATEVALGRVADLVDEPLRSLLLGAIDGDGGIGIGARLCRADAALRPLGVLLRQSEELGVPIAGALRLLAVDARERARLAARERAAAAAPQMLLVVGGLLAPASLMIVIGGQLLVLRDVAGGLLV